MRVLALPPIVLLVTVVAMFWLHSELPAVQLVSPPVNWAGLALVVGGLGIADWHARLFRHAGTNINTFGKPGRLILGGMFRRTRNPMYLGMVVCLVGVAVTLGSASPIFGPLGFLILANHWYIPIEEAAMIRAFGKKYLDYRRSVPRWL